MGELSKKIGEEGESVVQRLLQLIGWGSAQKGLDIDCNFPRKHRAADRDRTTHGLDYFHSMRNPLLGDVVDHLVISVKCTAEAYPAIPTGKFKTYFDDLAKALECTKRSHLRRDAGQRFTGVTKSRDIGLLVWLTLDNKSYTDVVTRVVSSRDITDAIYDTIYVLDNERAQFLLDSHAFVERIRNSAKMSYCYPDSGQNMSPLRRATEGDVLPVEYITSAVLPFRLIANDGSRKLVLATRDPFSKEAIQRLLDLAHRLTQNWAHDVVIAFPDYENHRHSNEAQAAKGSLADESFTARVTIECLHYGLRSLNHE